MSLWELFILAVGLSMDAFSVAVCKGLSVAQVKKKHILTAGIYFGLFQALMPAVGYLLGTGFQAQIQAVDHWIAFILLSIIGIKMIRDFRGDKESNQRVLQPHNELIKGKLSGFCNTNIDVKIGFLYYEYRKKGQKRPKNCVWRKKLTRDAISRFLVIYT